MVSEALDHTPLSRTANGSALLEGDVFQEIRSSLPPVFVNDKGTNAVVQGLPKYENVAYREDVQPMHRDDQSDRAKGIKDTLEQFDRIAKSKDFTNCPAGYDFRKYAFLIGENFKIEPNMTLDQEHLKGLKEFISYADKYLESLDARIFGKLSEQNLKDTRDYLHAKSDQREQNPMTTEEINIMKVLDLAFWQRAELRVDYALELTGIDNKEATKKLIEAMQIDTAISKDPFFANCVLAIQRYADGKQGRSMRTPKSTEGVHSEDFLDALSQCNDGKKVSANEALVQFKTVLDKHMKALEMAYQKELEQMKGLQK